MGLARNGSTSSFETVGGWVQSPRYCLMIPGFSPRRCLPWKEQDGERCGLSVTQEGWSWASLGLDVTCSCLWEEEQLKPVFQDIADTSLCWEHKSQMKLIEEMIWQDAWRSEWITEYHRDSDNKTFCRRGRIVCRDVRARLRTDFGRLKAPIFRSSKILTDSLKAMPADRRSSYHTFFRRTLHQGRKNRTRCWRDQEPGFPVQGLDEVVESGTKDQCEKQVQRLSIQTVLFLECINREIHVVRVFACNLLTW